MLILSAFLARLFDPALIIVAVICGGIFRHPAKVIGATIVAGLSYELLLANLSYRSFSFPSFVMATLAGFIWSALGFWVSKRSRRIQARENALTEPEIPSIPPRYTADRGAESSPSFVPESNPTVQVASPHIEGEASMSQRRSFSERLGLGNLHYPFIAASSALILLGLLIAPLVLPHESAPTVIVYAMAIGILSSVVVWAVMKAVVQRTSAT